MVCQEVWTDILSVFLGVIAAHLLPLTNYLANGQYAKVQPIGSKFAERCICTTLTPSCHAQPRTTGNAWECLRTTVFFRDYRGLVVSQSRSLVVPQSRRLVVSQSRWRASQSFSAVLSHSQLIACHHSSIRSTLKNNGD